MSDRSPPSSLVALRDRRERAIQQISAGFVADLLTVDEFEARLVRVHAAASLTEIERAVADLDPAPAHEASTALVPLALDPSLAPSMKQVRALLGSVERRGSWVVPARLAVIATFGNVEIDFREARFAAPVAELQARATLGNIEIIVPPQLAVDCEGAAVLGNFESHGAGAVADPDRPLLRIRGRAVLGSIAIHTRLPTRVG